ncbi:MAG: glutamyl-Q tRNA(Asp) synthetase [Rhizobiaceae bacterium]
MVLSADRPVFRFAPSPNGELHLGHAYSALLNDKLARQTGGRLLLRIEDIDTERCTPEFEAGIFRDLEWLGVEWEAPARRQSEHFEEYRGALDRLVRDGIVYPAFMSRGDIRAFVAGLPDGGKDWPRDPDGAPHYPPADKALADFERRQRIDDGEAFAWRLDMQKALDALGPKKTPTPNPSPRGGGRFASVAAKFPSPLWGGVRGGGVAPLSWREFPIGQDEEPTTVKANPSRWGDVILARKDIPTSYNLSVVLDDALQGVTHIVRGQDLFEATSVHRLLQELLGLPEPVYHHHRLIMGPDSRKLSKSFRDTGLRTLREAGKTPSDIRATVGFKPGKA